MGFGLWFFYRRVLGQRLLVRLRIIVRLRWRLFGIWCAMYALRADSMGGRGALIRHGNTPSERVEYNSKIGQARMRYKRRMKDQGAPAHTGKYLFPDNLQFHPAHPLRPA